MKEIADVLKKYDLRTNKYQIIGKVTIADTSLGKIVLKPKINNEIYNYLDSRQFDYYPKNIIDDDNYLITNYLEDVSMPKEQKISDLITLIALLHNKTSYYENVDEDYYKKIYEDLNNNINYLFNYYDDIMTYIESKVYMSPSEYLLAKNISIIFSSLKQCHENLDKWFEEVKKKDKRRVTVIHNNLDLTHYIRNKENYLLSWDKAYIDEPIYDLYNLYKKYALDFDFESLFKKYEKHAPLNNSERNLLKILILMPDKININQNIYDACLNINNVIDYLYKTNIILKNNFQNTENSK